MTPAPPLPWSRSSVVLLMLALLAAMFVLPVVGSLLPLPRRADRQLIQMLLSMGGMLLTLVGVITVLILDTRRTARRVGWGLAGGGFVTTGYMMRGRQGEATVAGRVAQAFWIPGSRGRPPSLELSTGCQVGTRLAVGDRSGSTLASAFGGRELQLGDLDLAHLRVTADEEGWARRLLAHPEARGALVRLAQPVAGEVRWVRIEPGAVHLRTAGMSAERITPEVVGSAAQDLVKLASLAEQAPAPDHPTQATAVERALRHRNGAVLVVVVILTFLAVIAVGGVMAAMQLAR
jgi:hypothetical protein